jgi:hypothetical protein
VLKNKRPFYVPFFCLTFFLLASVPGYSRGKTQEEEKSPLNGEWVLCVTAFDVSSLPVSQRVMGDILTRNLAKSLTDIHHRVRVSPEYAYYENLAWTRSFADAGKKLAAKRNERDLLLYKGYPDWRYRNELKTIDAAIVVLEEEYGKAEKALMNITQEPAFKLSQGNRDGSFPAPPEINGEYRFCATQKADAFLSGEISEFHGRFFLNLRLYTLYTRSFEYEEHFLFSTEDLSLVVDELTGRLVAAVSGAPPSALSVTVQPEDAVILVKESFAGQGDTGIVEYPPGPVDVVVFANGYNGASSTVELAPGELVEMEFTLRHQTETSMDITVPGYEGASIYEGSLYLGEAPLTFTAPLNQFEYIRAETPDGDASSVVFRAGHTARGISLPLSLTPDREAKPLASARRKYYGAWARFWIALPTAFIVSGMTKNYEYAYNYQGDPDVGKKAQTLNVISIGTWVVVGIVAVDSIYRMVRYAHTASKSIPAIAK